jgi:hypothetical protein
MRKKIKEPTITAPIEVSNAPAFINSYAASEDIYTAGKKEEGIDMDSITAGEQISDIIKQHNVSDKNKDDTVAGLDLDVPGSELDDQQEAVGSEDEENNYYSIGGDDHTDLEEDFRE